MHSLKLLLPTLNIFLSSHESHRLPIAFKTRAVKMDQSTLEISLVILAPHADGL